MRLALASVAANVLSDIINYFDLRTDGTRVLFIPTAANLYDEKWFVDVDREALVNSNFVVCDIDLAKASTEALRAALNSSDIIFVAGGNTFYLLEQANRIGFRKLLVEQLEKNKLYIGSSAGAILVGPTLEHVKFDDPDYAEKLDSLKGLDLVNVTLLPHYGKPKYQKVNDSILEKFKHLDILTLTDNQCLMVQGDTQEVVNASTKNNFD